MTVSYADRVKESWTGTGTGSVSLGGAQTGFRAFSAAFTTGNTVHYCIENPALGEWEVGLGTLTSGSPWTLARTNVLASSNANNLVNFSAGTKNVFDTIPASVLALIQNHVTASRQITAGTGLTGGGDLTSDRTLAVDVGTAAGKIVQLDPTTGKLPAVDGSQLTHIATTAVSQQVFTSSGTWNKPGAGTWVLIEAWGGGGSGAKASSTRGGGGGGGYNYRWILLSALGATESVTIGSGGASQTASNASGNDGGNTTFGSWLTAYGGNGGQYTVGGGGGGGQLGAGALGLAGSPRAGAAGASLGDGGVSGNLNGSPGYFHGGGGAYFSAAGGDSVWGGGGGGGAGGGASKNAGAGGIGGSGVTNGTDGTAPSGGGGHATTGTQSGAGAAGQCRVTVF